LGKRRLSFTLFWSSSDKISVSASDSLLPVTVFGEGWLFWPRDPVEEASLASRGEERGEDGEEVFFLEFGLRTGWNWVCEAELGM